MTGLVGGTRVSKADARLEAYGTADELNSFIGWLRAVAPVSEVDAWLEAVQNELFCLGGYLALDRERCEPSRGSLVEPDAVRRLEEWTAGMEDSLPQLRAFIIPGGSEAVSRCHICRTVCRRAERYVVALMETDEAYQKVQVLLNRLSDFFFTLARFYHKKMDVSEKIW